MRRERGEGGLHWDISRQRWIATVTIGYNNQGKRITRKASGTTKTQAKAKLREMLHSQEDGEPIPPEFVMRTRRDMTHAQHQVQHAVEKLIEVCGARSVYDAEPLASIRRDLLTVLTHNVASRQAAMGAWGKWALSGH